MLRQWVTIKQRYLWPVQNWNRLTKLIVNYFKKIVKAQCLVCPKPLFLAAFRHRRFLPRLFQFS